MGQRTQLIVRVPPIYWNENNPNNRNERILVFHNQWLYGKSFLKFHSQLLEDLETLIDKEVNQKSGYPIQWDSILYSCIHHCNFMDLNSQTYTHPYFFGGGTWNRYNRLVCATTTECETFRELLTYVDNNNGYFLIYIDDDLSISYNILSGLEDMDQIMPVDPNRYYRLFYPNGDIPEWIAYVIKHIGMFPVVDIKQFESCWGRILE